MNQFVTEPEPCREHLLRVIGAKFGNSERLSCNLRFVAEESSSNGRFSGMLTRGLKSSLELS